MLLSDDSLQQWQKVLACKLLDVNVSSVSEWAELSTLCQHFAL